MTLLRLSGLFYLAIILAGLGGELALRGPLVTYGDATATGAAIRAAPALFRASIGTDLVMALSDVALALCLFQLFRAAAPGLALAALVFRLVQAVLIAANFMALQAAWMLASAGQDAQALMLVSLHAHGYDLGLVFFGVNCLLMARLLTLQPLFATRWTRALPPAIAIAGVVYLVGSALRFFAPGLMTAFQPAYGLTILAEGAFCVALLTARPSARRPGA
ncbi:DUF4386 domain-containing protein [Mesobacterium pallidum]|uniref:DUF4386 domain-containing protein n=1 Tax=Mesobacterium pallidum TaxID=2872037 RepID=UPI001EE28579|nr:DUF4386 domain-containing protein [Mesobacterium pallidum]